jgi:Vacuolar protein sorting-associated protein 35
VQQLAELVGKNLNQLAGLGGLTFQHYKSLVLPGITEQIVHCEDKLAQRFLMEVSPSCQALP